MIQTSKPHVSLTYVLNFTELDRQVRFNQALAEASFGSLVNGQSQQTNLPDDFDPGQPRIFFPSDKKSIAISQIACQFSLNFAGSGIPFPDEIEIGKKNISAFCQRALQFKPVYNAHALVLELRYPSPKSNVELAKFLHDRFLKIDPIGGAASTIIQLGYSYEGLYLNLNINPYESRKLPEVGPNQTFVRAESLPVLETGIQIRIDVNNLLNFQQSSNEGAPGRLMAALEKFLSERFEETCGLPLP